MRRRLDLPRAKNYLALVWTVARVTPDEGARGLLRIERPTSGDSPIRNARTGESRRAARARPRGLDCASTNAFDSGLRAERAAALAPA